MRFLETLLAALAETTEQEMDSGRWTKRVAIEGHPAELTLALPAILEPEGHARRLDLEGARRSAEGLLANIQRVLGERQFESIEEANAALAEQFVGRSARDLPSTASTPLERAQDLCYEAYDAAGRRRFALAPRALELSPDCGDAYVILAGKEDAPEESLVLYEQGIAAGRRALGTRHDELAGAFWGDVTTRPYMRARMGRANVLEDLGRHDEAIAEYQEMLRLNPNDNQGVRDILIGLLFTTGRDREAAALLDSYAGDHSATFAYARLLAAFRAHADAPETREALARAITVNRWGAEYLLDWDLADAGDIGAYRPGGEEEAMVCADEIGSVWQHTPGALDWLRERVEERHAKKAAAAHAARKRRKGRRR